MKRYLLDTNVLSETRKPKPHGAVVAWLTGLRDDQVFLSAVTMGELQAGIELTRRQDPAKASEIERWVDELENRTRSYLWIQPRSGMGPLIKANQDHLIEDGMIAATARKFDLIVATRNEGDFKQLGVPVFNPFKVSP